MIFTEIKPLKYLCKTVLFKKNYQQKSNISKKIIIISIFYKNKFVKCFNQGCHKKKTGILKKLRVLLFR